MKNQFFSRLEWDTSQLFRKSLTSLRALTLLLVMCLSIGNVWGQTYTYKNFSTSFKKGTTSGTSISSQVTTSNLNTIVSSNDLFKEVSAVSNVYYNDAGCGIRISKSKGAGSVTFTLTNGLQDSAIYAIVVYASKVSGNTKATCVVTPAGGYTTETEYGNGDLTAYSAEFTGSNYKLDTIKVGGQKLTSITFASASAGYTHLHQVTLVTQTAGSGSAKTTVTYDANGVTGYTGTLPTDATEYAKDATITLSTDVLSHANYAFKGWNSDKDASAGVASVTATGSPMTIYAIWAEKTITALTVSGNPDKKTYEDGQTLDPTGLVVTATYSDETQGTITEGIEWLFDPETLSVGDNSCEAIAGKGSIVSEAYVVTGLTVTAAIAGDTLTRESTGVSSGASYSSWTKKKGSQGVVEYAGNTAGGNNSIQMRNSSYSGIVSTTSIGNITAVKVDWESHTTTSRSLEIYGSNVAYTDASNLFGDNKGTLLGTIVKDDGQKQLVISGKYKYVGLKAVGGAIYLNHIILAWEESTDPSIIVTPDSLHFEALDNGATDTKKFGIDTAYITGVLSAEIIDDADSKFSAAAIANDSVAVTFTPNAKGNFSAKLVVKSMKSDIVEASDTVILTGEGLDSNVPVTGVTVNKQELSLEKNATETLTATVTPDNASVKTVTWSSDNTEVATVDANGLVTAIKKGTANIIATSNNNIKDTCVLTVTLPATWELVTDASDLAAGDILILAQSARGKTATDISSQVLGTVVSTFSTDKSEITAVGEGTLRFTLCGAAGAWKLAVGTDTLCATAAKKLAWYNGTGTKTWSISIDDDNNATILNGTNSYGRFLYNYNSGSDRFAPYATTTSTSETMQMPQLYKQSNGVPSVKLNKKSTSISVGAKETLTATVKNSEATVVWSTLDDLIATVNNGEITAEAQGETKIIATITDAGVNYADTCVVTVTPAATVTSVTIDPQDATLYIYGTTKQTKNFTATVVGENEPAQTVTWKSLDEEVATVSEAGVVSAVAAGTTKIVAISTVDDTKSDTADVVVKVFENTAETAYTTAEAIELIDALGTAIKDIQVYVKGIVSKNEGLASGAITYWLDEDAFEVYKGKSFEGNNFSSVDDIKVNDKVLVKGKLKKFGSTYEFDSNSQLISRKTAAVLTWSKGAYTAPLSAAEYDYPTLTVAPSNISVTYSSSDTEVATIDAATGAISLIKEGPTTIKATFAGNDTLFAAEATYALTVAAAVQYYTITYNSNGGSEIAPVADQTNLPATFPTPTKDFKVFGGWYFDNNVFEVAAVANMPLTKDTTLYAKWDEPKSITEMIALIPTSGDEVDNVYGWGYIKAGATVSSGNANYYITDGSDNDFYIYKGLNVNGESFTSADQLPSGNKVMIYGDIKNYNGTPEFTQGSRIINNAAVEVPVTGVSLNKATAEVMVGKNVTLVATVAPSHATNQNVTWSSNKESIATVDATGKVTGVAAGDATITVTTEDGGFQASCAVTVVAAPTFDNGIWVKVTNTDDLTADSYVIIAAKSYTKAIKTYVSGNNHGAQDVTVSGEILSYTTAPAIFQVKDYVKSEVTVGKAFLNIESGNYLYLQSSANQLTETASMVDNSAFTFAITDGVHSLTNYSISTRQMKYNNSSSCFACYTSGQDNIVVYKYMEGAFALSFDANGGQKTSVPGSMIVQGAVTIPSDVPTHATAGTKFAYYTPDKAGEGTHYVPGQENCEFTQNTTLYAQWNVLTARHITYNAGGGTGSVPTDAVNYYEGDSVTLKAATNLSNPGHIFSSWEVSYNNGEKQIVEVSDNNKFAMPDYDVTATAIWTAKTNDKWVLVTSEDQLVAGEKYVIACNSKGKVAGDINGTYLEQKDATFSSDDMYIKGMTDKLVLTLGGETDAWTFTNEDSEVLGATAEKALSFTNGTTTWKISVSSTATTIQNTNTDYGYMKYNASSPRFTTYKNSGTAIQLYRMIPAVVVEDETVNASDLNDYANITVGEGGNLTLTSGTKTLGDVYVMAGGKVTLEESVTLTVQNFVIKSIMAGGQSGQVIGVTASNLVIQGDAYYDVTLDGNADPDKWHAVGVPFDVDAINGIYDMDDNKLVNETNYAFMVYQGDVRAQGKYGWIKIQKTNDKILHPGVFYLFGVDGKKGTTYRFKMNGGFSVASKSIMVYEYPQTSGVSTDAGWNGIGNTQLEYSAIDKPVQVLNISSYTFVTKTASSTNFTVGTPFFYQAEGTGYVTLVTGADKPAYAPARMGNEAKDIDVTLANEKYTDHLYLSATDEATNEYQIGRDLTKMTMTSTPVVPQIFGQAYNTKLCMVDAPMVNDQASYSVLLYAPAAGEYTMSAAQVEGYEVFLTKNGEVIWNLSMSAATVELAKGDNTGYGIVIKKAPQVTTDMENAFGNGESIQKFIFNDNLYIIRGEKVFDAQGKLVK